MNIDDRKLIDECLNGQPNSFGALVLRYQDRLFRALVCIVNDPEDAYDAAQDAFLNAYLSLHSFKGDSEFYTWLYRIAFNAAISQKRKKRPVVSLDQNRNGQTIPEPSDHSIGVRPDERMERSEDEIQLHVAIQRLSAEHRNVLVLKDIDGMKYEEIAEFLKVPIGTVRSRLHRARLELKLLLSAHDNDSIS